MIYECRLNKNAHKLRSWVIFITVDFLLLLFSSRLFRNRKSHEILSVCRPIWGSYDWFTTGVVMNTTPFQIGFLSTYFWNTFIVKLLGYTSAWSMYILKSATVVLYTNEHQILIAGNSTICYRTVHCPVLSYCQAIVGAATIPPCFVKYNQLHICYDVLILTEENVCAANSITT